jgi:transposase
MINLTPQHRIFICTEVVDFRKGIDGMAGFCKNILNIDPYSGAVFAFANRRKEQVRLLIYDGNGFWLCRKRFSEGKLKWWPQNHSEAEALTPMQLQIILQQSDPRAVKLRPNWRELQ